MALVIVRAYESRFDVMSTTSGTPKLEWSDLPEGLRQRIEGELSTRVVKATSQPGGFSPGAALRVRLADGTRAFIKTTSREINQDTFMAHRRESEVVAQLAHVEQVPALWSRFEHGPWFTQIFEDVAGQHPVVPWDPDELRTVSAAMRELADTVTPNPVQGLPRLVDALADDFAGWQRLAEDLTPIADLDPWMITHVDQLAERASRWTQAWDGDALVHGDVRADQLLLSDGRVYLIDWSAPSVGNPDVDLFFMLPSSAMLGGPSFDDLLELTGLAHVADPEALTSLGAALASFFIEASTRPAPPGLPTVRDFQHDQGQALIDWLKHRI